MSLRWTDQGRKVFFLHVFPFLSFFQTLFGGGGCNVCHYFSWLFCLVCFLHFASSSTSHRYKHVHMLKHTCTNSCTADVVICAAYIWNLFSKQMILSSFHYNRLLFRNNLPSTIIKISLCVCVLFDKWQRISQKSINYKSHQPPVM